MRVEIHVNGSLVLELQPENDIERMVLTEMAAGAERGKRVSIGALADLRGAVTVSVEK